MTETTPGHLAPELLELLLEVALDLTGTFAPEERYRRLVRAVRHALPCDAAVLLRRSGDDLVVLASHGLSDTGRAQRFTPGEHPRLEIITHAEGPTIFPPDSHLADPFDGLLADDLLAHDRVHACFGCPLRLEGELVGVLTADAKQPGAFDAIDPRFLATLGALAAATVRTSHLVEALEREATRSGNVAADLMREARQRGGQLLGSSPPMQRLREEIRLLAPSDMTVLVTGETGTGKELVVQAIHQASRRSDAPLIYVNCAALPESIAESELFGHVRGAFTGAHTDRPGKFEVAHDGTLFLDEVGELSERVQALLLRALQEGEVQRVGADVPHRVDARVLAATNRDLEAEVERGRFRADLYHRLAVYRLETPPLRTRREDIPFLAGAFADNARRRLGLGPVRVNHPAQVLLRAADWPGNVRELENVISRAVLTASANTPRGATVTVGPDDLALLQASAPTSIPPPAAALPVPELPLRQGVEAYKRQRVEAALRRHEGSWAAAARELGMHRSNLYHLAKRLGLGPAADADHG